MEYLQIAERIAQRGQFELLDDRGALENARVDRKPGGCRGHGRSQHDQDFPRHCAAEKIPENLNDPKPTAPN